MLVDIILVAIGVVWVAAAAIFDIRTKEIPGWLSFSLISAGLGVRLIYSLSTADFMFFLYGLLGLALAAALGAIFYYSHIWGGGDSKLLMGLGAVFATGPYFVQSTVPFLVALIINILVFGALYGMVWSSVLVSRNFKKVMRKTLSAFHETVALRYALFASAVVVVLLTLLFRDNMNKLLLVILAASLIVYYLLFITIRAVEKVVMYKVVPVRLLRVGDWIAEPVIVHGKVLCGPEDYGLTNAQINALHKHHVKEVIIKDGMAFVPAFVLGLAFSLFFGDVIFFLF